MKRLIVCLVIGLLTISLSAAQRHPAWDRGSAQVVSAKVSPVKREALKSLNALPLSFEANRGQSDARVKFLSRGLGYTISLTPAETVLSRTRRIPSASPIGESFDDQTEQQPVHYSYETDVAQIRLIGADPDAEATGLDEQITRSNYFIGNDPKRWVTDIQNYARVRFKEVYPGIDVVYYDNHHQLEYDFVVAAKADPTAIRFSIEGGGRVEIDHDGNLEVNVEGSRLTLRRPVAWQEIDGRRREIASAFRVLAGDRIGFRLSHYDAGRPLIIDPVLSYASYLGGTSSYFNDGGAGIAVDSSGNAYVTGFTGSSSFPTLNPYQSHLKFGSPYQCLARGQSSQIPVPCPDAFISKLNASGTALIYSTYLGGTNVDYPAGIALDSSGAVYIAGLTESADFPVTTGAFQTTSTSGGAQFITKLNPSGSSLAYSTYFDSAGGAVDSVRSIAVDSSGNAYIAGWTHSSSFPVTANAFQKQIKTGSNSLATNAFVTKIDASGASLAYSTYLGGSNHGGNNNGDGAFGVVVDAQGSAYLAGATSSDDFPVTAGAFQTKFKASGGSNAYVTKLNSTGSALVYSTYLGGSSGEGCDNGCGIAVDSAGNAYVTGGTSSTDFPLTSGAVQSKPGGVFISELNPSGSGLAYSTYLGDLGGSNADSGAAIAVDASGRIFVAGNAGSTDFPVTADAIQKTNLNGSSIGFVAVLDPAISGPSALVFSSYFGGQTEVSGPGKEALTGMALDASGNMYIVGSTGASDFPATAGSFQTKLPGSESAFLAKININTSAGGPTTISALVSSANYQPGFAAMSFVSAFGSFPGASAQGNQTVPAATSLGGIQVLVNRTAAPLMYVSSTQINFLTPANTPNGPAQVVIAGPEGTSAPATINIATYAPALFAWTDGTPLIQYPDSSLGKTAHPGGEITLYGTAFGPVNNTPADGDVAPGAPNLAVATGNFTITVGGVNCPIDYLGLGPGEVAVYQINLFIPNNVPTGAQTMAIYVNGSAQPLYTNQLTVQ